MGDPSAKSGREEIGLQGALRPSDVAENGLGLVEKNLAWYLIHGRLSAQRAQAVTAYIDRLIARIRPHALDLVDAFGYSPDHLRATIASGIERERQNEARDYYADRRASGAAPAPEKSVKR